MSAVEIVAAQLFTTGVGRRYRYEWALFADWCTAMDRGVLPADSATVLEFLIANPAGEATQVRRVSAINWVHRHRGHSEPGAAPALRETLDARRQHRLVGTRTCLAPILQQLPTSGWPGGLFGRRDAVVLLFAGAGLRFERIARLRRDEVSVAGDDVVVGGHRITTDWTGESATDIYQRWIAVLDFSARYPSTRMLAAALRDDRTAAQRLSPKPAGGADSARPVFVPIDRWGHLPLAARARLSAAAVAAIVAAHVRGESPEHAIARRTVSVSKGRVAVVGDRLDTVEQRRLDPHTFERGLHARHRAHTALVDVGDILDLVADHADRLFEQTLALLEGSDID